MREERREYSGKEEYEEQICFCGNVGMGVDPPLVPGRLKYRADVEERWVSR